MSVKYQVERRPVCPLDGKVYRGTGFGDYIMVPTESKRLDKLPLGNETSLGTSSRIYPAGTDISTIKTGEAAVYSHLLELNGEPWLVHSTHFSVESALESAAPLSGALGKENVRIVKVLSHTTVFKLN